MQDLAARVSDEVRDAATLDAIGDRLEIALKPGRYLFATVHRQENREPAAMAAWAGILAAAASPERPVVLALHPGTRAAMDRAGVTCGPNVRLIEPQGYRTALALQLHAAAVLTDSGGIQREAAWLGVPCLVLRSSTEWAEAVRESEGRMVVVGLDAGRARLELERLAPSTRAEVMADARARQLHLRPAGAADAIVAALAARRPGLAGVGS